MASAKAKIRHVFGDTFSCRAAPPDILVELSGSRLVQSIEFYYIWREHANLSSVKQLKQKTWRISDESSRHLTPSHAI